MRFSGFVNCLLLAGFALPAAAASNWSDAEIKLLPPFCEERLKRAPGQVGPWQQMLGEDFVHTHHYCNGLGHINRYYRARTRQQKTYSLQNAYGGLDYMVRHASPGYSLMPDVYLNRGLVFSLMGDHGKAMADLKKALELNPKLVRAYTLSSEIELKLKKPAAALAVVNEGLRHVPDSKALQRVYRERGGKLPYPEPIAEAAATPEDKAAPAGEPAGQAAAGAAPGQGASAAAAPVKEEPRAAEAQPKIGSPTNPWCRFCPEPAQ